MLDQSRPPQTIAARLSDGLGEFFAVWKISRAPDPRSETRQFKGLLALVVCGGIVAIGYWLDAAATIWAKTLPLPLIHVFERITRLGESGYIFALVVLTALFAALARYRGRGARVDAGLTQLAARAMFLFDVAAVSGIASQVVKHLFGRSRPKLMADGFGPFHFDVFSISASYASFPSGHAVTAFAMATAISWLVPRLTLPLFLLAGLIALSRVIIGAHYPSDIAAGAALGVGSALLLRREFTARGIVFKAGAHGVRLRGRGMIWRATRRAI